MCRPTVWQGNAFGHSRKILVYPGDLVVSRSEGYDEHICQS